MRNNKLLALFLIMAIYVSISSHVTTSSSNSLVLFIYSSDNSDADSYFGFLESNGYSTDLIELSKITTEGIDQYDLILVGSDTGGTYNHLWGDDDKIASINDSNKTILGLGEGGYDFFGRLSLAIGRGNGWHGNENSILVMNNSHPVFTLPNLISDETVQLYTSSSHVGIYLQTPSNDVVLLGREPEDLNHYPLVQEKDRYLLWGFTGNPGLMTQIGKQLFINI